MKLLGMIGGTSWHATEAYYRLINEGVAAEIGSQGNPPLLLYSLNIELMRSQQWDKINAHYLEIALKLQKAGVEALIICANTPHKVYDFVQPKIEVPILHIADAVGIEAQKLGLSSLGLLGNRPTMTGEFISGILKEKYQINTIIPEAEALPKAHHYVSQELTRGIFTEQARTFFSAQMKLLQERGADGIILGCTELPLLFEGRATVLPALSTTDLHARMAVDFILGK